MMKIVCLICYIMENKNMENKKLDQSMTIHVNNDELEKLVAEHIQAKNADSLNKLLNHLATCRILVPAMKGPDPSKPMPALLQTGNGETLLPVFTSLKQTEKAPKSQGIINMPFIGANDMVAKSNGRITGIAINPFTENLVFKAELVQKIAEVEEMKKKGIKQVKMTGAQYAVFERVQFEKGFLPKKFFAEEKLFLLHLDERREAYLDVLFEESYQQKRMYPYLEEDFSVMVMTISEDLMIARVEFPNKDLAPGVSLRAFLAWDNRKKEARYFTIDMGKESGSKLFLEVTKEMKVVNLGAAPVDGTELQRVVDLVQTCGDLGYTS